MFESILCNELILCDIKLVGMMKTSHFKKKKKEEENFIHSQPKFNNNNMKKIQKGCPSVGHH